MKLFSLLRFWRTGQGLAVLVIAAGLGAWLIWPRYPDHPVSDNVLAKRDLGAILIILSDLPHLHQIPSFDVKENPEVVMNLVNLGGTRLQEKDVATFGSHPWTYRIPKAVVGRTMNELKPDDLLVEVVGLPEVQGVTVDGRILPETGP